VIGDYVALLEEFGLRPKIRGPWALVGEVDQVQGWKLHISSIPTEAPAVLQAIVPLLARSESCFKVVQDQDCLFRLNEGLLGSTQIGKFLTIYPECNADSLSLANQLVPLTSGFHGPRIVTDLRLGQVLYTRYGNYNPLVFRDRFGNISFGIYAADGSIRADEYAVPFRAPVDVDNPFREWQLAEDGVGNSNRGRASLFGPGYLILDLVKNRPTGGTFRAIDLRSQEQAGVKIIKQGRQYCLSDEFGRDIKSRLRHQQSVHRDLLGLVPVPTVDAYFEVDDNGYLALQEIEGRSLDNIATTWCGRGGWEGLEQTEQRALLGYLLAAIEAVASMHNAGYVHRDLSTSNIWVARDNSVWLLDLELAFHMESRDPPFRMGTPGFTSPGQEQGEHPSSADDVYALACVMIRTLTGLDPRYMIFSESGQRRCRLDALCPSLPRPIIDAINAALAPPPARGQSLDSLRGSIDAILRDASERAPLDPQRMRPALRMKPTASWPRSISDAELRLMLRRGTEGLIHETIVDDESGLWLSAVMDRDGLPGHEGPFALRRSANRGVAGVVYTLSRLTRAGYGTEASAAKIRRAIGWLLDEHLTPDLGLPGLHFGDAGVALSIAEAIAAGVIGRSQRVDEYLQSKLAADQLDWPDITHGAAGQGLAALACGDLLKDGALTGSARRCANYLLECQEPDGSWRLPPGVDGISGQTLTGFAHGVAGIAYFLCEYWSRSREQVYKSACRRAACWLMNSSLSKGPAVEWAYSDTSSDRWIWWCHGSPGIALCFLRLYECFGDERYADIASRALMVHNDVVLHTNLSQCHGLSGLGEIYLESGRVLGDARWMTRAKAIATTLYFLSRAQNPRASTWLVEDPNMPTADLMVGCSGVLHFLLRMTEATEALGFPLLATRMRGSSS
jgi:serine/threonine protein kinase